MTNARNLPTTVVLLVLLCAGASTGCFGLRGPTDPYEGLNAPHQPPVSGGATPVSEGMERSDNQSSHSGQSFSMGEPLALETAIEMALANNPDVRAMSWEARAMTAHRQKVAGARLPAVYASTGYGYHPTGQRLVPVRQPDEPSVFTHHIFNADLAVTVPLFDGGRLRGEIGAAEMMEQVAAHRVESLKNRLVFEVSKTFYWILGQRKVIEALEFSLGALQEHLRTTAELVAMHKAAQVDVLRLEVRLADLRHELVRERNSRVVGELALWNLIGFEDVPSDASFEGDLGYVSGEVDCHVELVGAFERRPEHREARSALEAQAKRVDLARARHWPVISALGAYGVRTDIGGNSAGVGMAGLGLSVPVFLGGAVEAEVRQESARLAAARESLRSVRLRIGHEVEVACREVVTGMERITATELSVGQAKMSLDIEQEKHRLGKGSVTDVLDAQAAVLHAETIHSRAVAETLIAKAGLDLAVGVGVGQ